MSEEKAVFQTRSISSLEKVFPDEELQAKPFTKASALMNEIYSFQVAYKGTESDLAGMTVKVEGDLQDQTEIRSVGLVPSNFPMYEDHDEDVLRTEPGLYPDPLYDLVENKVQGDANQWNTVWISVHLNKEVKQGNYAISISFKSSTGETLGKETFELEVIANELPEQELITTHWFHADCIATQYDLEIFSEEHWGRIAQYIDTAVKHGMNLLLTPLFTLPLDTEIGGERPTLQLVDVEKEGDHYTFGFDRLEKWVQLATNKGIKYFEFSHLFTQWGAYHAPKIIATEDGEEKQIFGWDTDAAGEDYKNFLGQFLPQLVAFIKENNLDDRSYFHVSDEPNQGTVESYKNASSIISEYLSDYPIIDALTDYEFYKEGYVKKPIPSNDRLDPFLENKVPDLWTYYCCAQYKKVSNRFFSFPSARNRISGLQFYKYDIKGFLHWGFNFWYSRLSKKQIDPFTNTDADQGFPSGDAFFVYPGENGPIESIRLEVFYDALQDLRALQLLESLTSKEEVIKLIEEDLDEALTFTTYPRESDWLLAIREKVNKAIKAHS